MSSSPHLSLHDWSCLRTELVAIYDHAPAARSRHGIFDHREGHWAWYMREGEVRVATKSGVVVAKAGQWLLLSSEVHRHDFSDDAQLLSLRFRCEWPTGEGVFNAPSSVVVDGREHPELEATAHNLERVISAHFPGPHQHQARQPSDYPLFLRSQRAFFEWLEAWFLARLATGAAPARYGGEQRAARAARAMDDAPFDRGFPAATLRTVTGVSRVQLNRLFRRQFKLTPLQYWERRRLEFAKLCLETSDLPLKELAACLGFRGPSHFTVWFKRHARFSPGRYRDRNTVA